MELMVNRAAVVVEPVVMEEEEVAYHSMELRAVETEVTEELRV
jgi:hypothetical protein